MRLILLIICLAVVWKLSSTYFDRTFELTRPQQTTLTAVSPMERAGAVEENTATVSQPVYHSEINKTKDVERLLDEAAERRKGN